jgi:hypothetical protein
MLVIERPPERLVLHIAASALGLGWLTTAPRPSAVVSAIPHWLVLGWALSLALSGLLGILAFVGLPPRARARLHGHVRPEAALYIVAVAEITACRLRYAALGVILSATLLVWWTTTLLPVFPYQTVVIFGSWLVLTVWRDRQIASLIKRLIRPRRVGGDEGT